MLIKSGEHAHLAQLLFFLKLGERLAHDCAQAQCALTSDRRMQKFLVGQARQEAYHAIVFQSAIHWLAPRFHPTSPTCDTMEQYRRILDSAISRRDFVETIIAEQIILEGLGEAILKKIEVGLVKRDAPFQKLRRILIHQEEAHHQFGIRILCDMIEREEESYETLRQRTTVYLALAKKMLFSAQDAFFSIDEDPQEYWDDFHQNLPDWFQPDSQKPIPRQPMHSLV